MYLGGNYVRVVYEKVWINLKMCAYKGVSWLDFATDLRLASRQSGTRVKHAGNWKVTIVGALQDKMYNLARLLARDLFRLQDWVARLPYLDEIWLFSFLTYPYTHKM